ncbi:DUF465 domain-containing protein [Natronospira bacteriovora]|uniref:DUF465 domain-containing protein n=1 Tax=Natronospira bacteriovora TaxID=3069753 RepID=A0ABU0W7C3_9GAMM|nr:DUF465 domain-containing protein [Natronospira sp. AB-CW4]MDQ2069658.1 DUF465 domain-containing protein [Natronospira sp. AB-CW4]
MLDDAEIEALKARIEGLTIEHRDLDDAIQALETAQSVDHLRLRRLKKRKLQLKDCIARLRSQMIPDLDA